MPNSDSKPANPSNSSSASKSSNSLEKNGIEEPVVANPLAEVTAKVRSRWIDIAKKRYPDLPAGFGDLVAPQLVSPFTVILPIQVKEQVERLAHIIHDIRVKSKYQEMVFRSSSDGRIREIPNFALCNSFDVHLDEEAGIHLIEINTNAAFYFAGTSLYEAQGLETPFAANPLAQLVLAAREEFQLVSKTDQPLRRIAILDEAPPEQKLYMEFLMAQSYFREQGLQCEILDAADPDLKRRLDEGWDLIYNRWTDFLLATPQAAHLNELYLSRKVALSPHPKEYWLLADKLRLQNFRDPEILSDLGVNSEDIGFLQAVIPGTRLMSEEARDEMWANRKNLFFKPAQSYGSKHAYKGASISRKAFEEYFATPEPMIAQDLWPALELQTPGGEQKFKYDLRFYFYKDQVQMGLARLYEGQVTNLRAIGGGFTAIAWSEGAAVVKPMLR